MSESRNYQFGPAHDTSARSARNPKNRAGINTPLTWRNISGVLDPVVSVGIPWIEEMNNLIEGCPAMISNGVILQLHEFSIDIEIGTIACTVDHDFHWCILKIVWNLASLSRRASSTRLRQ